MTDSNTYRTNRDLFSNHYLDDHLRETEPWNEASDADIREAYEEITELWTEKQRRVDDYNEAQLEKNFIRPIFEILGIPFEIEETVMRNARRPDYGFFPSEEAADSAFDREDFYEESTAVADAKRWGRKLDTRGKEKRDFENPSYQIHRYLQETPAQWAVLTNGEKWRLYYGPTSHRLDSYYEIDLPELLDVVDSESNFEAFKEFYLFFRQEAFLPDQTGDCFLDDVFDESSIFAEELGEDLQENIYEAIRVLAEGFLDTNDDLDEDDLDLIHDSSLIYLYRLIFVLYAESEGRNLLPTDNEIYSGSYSLNELKIEVVENRDATQQHYQPWQTDLWDQLDELFVLIDQGSQGKGIPKEDLYIPAYNGGLFRTGPDEDDTVESQFLSNYEAGDAYLAEVIELLTRHEADEGEGKVFVDYSSLDERNLGSIYEGLLEYKLDVADEPLTVDDGEYTPAGEDDDITVETDEVYLRTDDGERKATGSYYTPEYVVEYIVDETLGPLVDEIRTDLMSQTADTTHSREGGFADDFAERIFDLTVLDPAMGSGHFPVNAVDYLAREIIDAQEKQDRQAIDAEDAEIRPPTTEDGELRDINWARRKVAQRCIYGVDVNPLATELAKVSLWLRTLAAEQPLAFLDHHLKTGNSLVGSDIEDVLSDGNDDETEDGQLTLQESFDHTRQRAMEHVTDRFQDLLNIDNETLEDAKEMEAVYDEVRDDPLYKKLLAMANVHTADAFGLDVPSDADERMARALHSEAWENIEEQGWFKSAQAMAEDEQFFHWELEFPMAFYNQDGERKADAGFDAVIGNPPYVSSRNEGFYEVMGDYVDASYDLAVYQVDLYLLFTELAVQMTSTGGKWSYIEPDVWVGSVKGENVREWIVQKKTLKKIILPEKKVFDADVDTMIVIGTAAGESDNTILVSELSENAENESREVVLPEGGSIFPISKHAIILELIEEDTVPLEEIAKTGRGIGPYHHSVHSEETIENRAYHSNTKEDETYRPELAGKNIDRHFLEWGNDRWISYGEWLAEPREPELFEDERLLCRKILSDRLCCAFVDDDWLVDQQVYVASQFKNGYSAQYATAILASTLMGFYARTKFHEDTELFPHLRVAQFRTLPIRKVSFDLDPDTLKENVLECVQDTTDFIDNKSNLESGASPEQIYEGKHPAVIHNLLGELVKMLSEKKHQYHSLNLDLLDYLGNYEEGPCLPDIGLFQPTKTNILNATTEEYEKLQTERVRTKRDGPSVTVEATARYKPENKDEFETDTWGYTETEFYEAFTLTDLSDEEAVLVEAFVPVAVDEEIGGFRDNATKNNSLIDRLKGITLPDPDDVAGDLQRYIETKERADELNEKIEKTDQLIDQIVYHLYDLTDEQIKIVEETINSDSE